MLRYMKHCFRHIRMPDHLRDSVAASESFLVEAEAASLLLIFGAFWYDMWLNIGDPKCVLAKSVR
jgi:hypothetical protein